MASLPTQAVRADSDDSRTRQDLMESPWNVGTADPLNTSTMTKDAPTEEEGKEKEKEDIVQQRLQAHTS